MIIKTIKSAKRMIVIIFGFTILLLGIALLFLPGPGILIIILGLFILSAEYIWAKRLMNKLKSGVDKIKNKIS